MSKAFMVVPQQSEPADARERAGRYLTTRGAISRSEWAALRGAFRGLQLKRNEFFSVAGQEADRLAWVDSGVLRLFYTTVDGDEIRKHFFTAGDWFFGGLRPGHTSSVSVQALRQTSLVVAHWERLNAQTSDSLSWMRWLNHELTSYLQRKQEREVESLSLSTLERFGRFLHNRPALEGQVALRHIASDLGVTPTQLSRIRRRVHSAHRHAFSPPSEPSPSSATSVPVLAISVSRRRRAAAPSASPGGAKVHEAAPGSRPWSPSLPTERRV